MSEWAAGAYGTGRSRGYVRARRRQRLREDEPERGARPADADFPSHGIRRPLGAAVSLPIMPEPHQVTVGIDRVDDAVPPEKTRLKSQPLPTCFPRFGIGPPLKLPSSRPSWRSHISRLSGVMP